LRLERGGAPLAHAHQGVAGQGGDLQQDVEVEGVTGGHHPQQAGDQQDVKRIKRTQAIAEGFGHQRPRAQKVDECDRGHRHQDEGAQVVHPQGDAHRRSPARHVIFHHPDPQDLHHEPEGRQQRSKQRQGRQREGQALVQQGPDQDQKGRH
jgi:hypothetical protein